MTELGTGNDWSVVLVIASTLSSFLDFSSIKEEESFSVFCKFPFLRGVVDGISHIPPPPPCLTCATKTHALLQAALS